VRASGLTIGGATLFTSHIEQLAALTVRHPIPAVYQRREFAAAGGLVIVLQRLQHHRCVLGPRSVIEGQHDFLVTQEIVLFEMLRAEARTACGVDFDDPGETYRAGIITRQNFAY
jgi:hypothetical protein